MEEVQLIDALLELAERVGLEVRAVGASDGPVASALCRVRGEPWVVLSRSDPLELQIEVLAQGLRCRAADWADILYLPPAVRAVLSES